MVKNKQLWKNINKLILLAMFVTFLGLLLYPIDVLNDDEWKIKVNGGNTHYVDETIAVDSIYTKLRKAEGQTTRYIDCRTQSGTFLRYELNQADANRRPSKTKQGTAFTFSVPKTITPVPTKCKIVIDIRYSVFKMLGQSFRTVPEYQESKEFNLLPASERPQASDVTTQSNSSSSTPTSNTNPTTTVTRPGQTNTTTTNNTVNKPPARTSSPRPTRKVCTINLLGIKVNCKQKEVK